MLSSDWPLTSCIQRLNRKDGSGDGVSVRCNLDELGGVGNSPCRESQTLYQRQNLHPDQRGRWKRRRASPPGWSGCSYMDWTSWLAWNSRGKTCRNILLSSCLYSSLPVPPRCWPVIAVLDVEEEESPSHEHSQDGDGGQDAVEGHVDVAPLQTHKGAILGRLHPWETVRQSQILSILKLRRWKPCKHTLEPYGVVNEVQDISDCIVLAHFHFLAVC